MENDGEGLELCSDCPGDKELELHRKLYILPPLLLEPR